MNGQQYVTPLSDLPDLEDLEHVQARPKMQSDRPIDDSKYTKYIRPAHRMDMESGMASYGANPYGPQGIPMGMPTYGPPGIQESFGPHGSPQGGHPQGGHVPSGASGTQFVEKFANPQYNCIDIARHIQDCPICSKFYSSDKTIYIIVIVILAIVCLLLIKKVLNV